MAATSNGSLPSKKRKSYESNTAKPSSKRPRTGRESLQSESVNSPANTDASKIEHHPNGEEPDKELKETTQLIRKRNSSSSAGVRSENTRIDDVRQMHMAQTGSIHEDQGQIRENKSLIKSKTSTKDDQAPVPSRKPDSGMNLSAPSGGCFLDHDPVFVTSDLGEEFLVSATDREIRLLSLDSSLIVRSHLAPPSTRVCCYAVNPRDESAVAVVYGNGSTVQWNWRSNESSETRHLGVDGAVKALSLISLPNKANILVFLVNTRKHSTIYAGHKVLHKVKQKLMHLRVVSNGDYLIAHGSSTLLLGHRRSGSAGEDDFNWIELPLSSTPTSIDVRVVPKPSTDSNSSPKRAGLSLAIGYEDGQIHLYDDVATLFNHERRAQLPSPRILHWHRHAVASVKFSADGVYLISGGMETVLVLWQLNTGKKQFLPHLTSAIERLTVNSRGDRYALQMGDNSIMVLSTGELKPVANFAGLQMYRNPNPRSLTHAISWHPRNLSQLLLAVPSNNPRQVVSSSNRAFLQTFDMRTSRHVTRQALTRNNVTDFNEGPERTLIDTPDITHLAISSDGQWLASVDEWMPPLKDIAHLAGNASDLYNEQQKRREIHLKIWHWDNEQALWTLTTRADGPHARYDSVPGPGRILALITCPGDHGFVTVGEDSSVKIWRPRARTRHGVVLKDEQNRDEVEWMCKRTVDLPFYNEPIDTSDDASTLLQPSNACVAFSDDGSILAVNMNGTEAESKTVHFLDPFSGEITASKSGLANSGIVALGILKRYLITLSDSAIYIWDMINSTMEYKRKLKPWPKPESNHLCRMLAINHTDQTFAVSTSAREEESSKVEVFACDSSKVLRKESFDTSIEAILTTSGVRGYRLVFTDATIQTLTPAGVVLLDAPLSEDRSLTVSTIPANSVSGDGALGSTDVDMVDMSPGDMRTTVGDTLEDDRSVVRPEQLADIFDVAQSFALPPVKDMFYAVVKLFGREPIPLSQQVQVRVAS